MQPAETRTPIWPIGAAGIAVALIAAGTLAGPVTETEGLLLLNRYLARASFLVFALIYAAAPLARLRPGPASRAILRLRRSLGLGYALIMAAHLGAILAYARAPDALAFDALTISGGGAGLALIGAQAATSSDRAVRRLGRRAWQALHRVSIHWLWTVYAFTYLARVAERGLAYAPGLAAVLALLALRVYARRPRGAA